LLLSLDISTTCTGYCIFNNDGMLLESNAIVLNKIKDFFEKVKKVENVLGILVEKYDITNVAIEESLQSFRPGLSSAKTLFTLSKFNGIIQFLCYNYGIKIHKYNVNTARKLNGIKIDRKQDKSTKDQIVSHVLEQNINVYLPKKILKSGPRKGKEVYENYAYDIADAYIVGNAYCIENMK